MTPAETNRVGHKAEAVLSTPAKTTEQPSENDVSPQARPPQTSTRSRAYKQNHTGPWTLPGQEATHASAIMGWHPRTGPRN
ncbi:hypothetical protein Taro_017026 [Colocasia esculenta]|uniref:Uncharacterized protein n=1 Tax=Colocasia esculenta TaxID=4460 RepID=A0A843ULY8_COLES|nr:hypothetical protein [Colocasia esculenta]